jgi:hypothetical protein
MKDIAIHGKFRRYKIDAIPGRLKREGHGKLLTYVFIATNSGKPKIIEAEDGDFYLKKEVDELISWIKEKARIGYFRGKDFQPYDGNR